MTFQPLSNAYKAHPCSAANLWKNFSNFLIVVLSLLITFTSQGLWKKTNTYLEQPIIEFQRHCTFLLRDQSGDPNQYLFWSSFDAFNQLAQYSTAVNLEADRLVVPLIESEELDHNEDGKPDELLVNVKLRPPSAMEAFRVHNVFYALEVKVRLEYRALVETTGWMVGSVEHLFAGQSLTVWGDLHFLQKRPLPSYGLVQINNTTTNSSDLFDQEDFHLANFFPLQIQKRNFEQNFSVDLLGKTETWIPLFHSNDNFTQQQQEFGINFRILIREQNIVYQTDALELLKWAWIQYFAILIVVRYLIGELSSFLYENHVLGSVVVGHDQKVKIN
uniref:Transmembrane protein 231 n=1 Tax=Ditylenchus dipsaci TaxID=166011 RepID=A0A915EJG5_9BILA